MSQTVSHSVTQLCTVVWLVTPDGRTDGRTDKRESVWLDRWSKPCMAVHIQGHHTHGSTYGLLLDNTPVSSQHFARLTCQIQHLTN